MVFSQPCQTSKMETSAKINRLLAVDYCRKISILDVWGSEYARKMNKPVTKFQVITTFVDLPLPEDLFFR